MNSPRYQDAYQAVKAKKGFYKHLSSYILVNGAMFLVTLFTGGGFSWAPILLFWGIGLGSHYIKVFGFPGSGVLSKEWEERELEKEMRRRGEHRSLPDGRRNQMDEHLDLKEIEKNYRESDLV